MKKAVLLILILAATFGSRADSLYIKVHFLYGSKPRPKFRSTESKYFGGLHGGHVTIEVDNVDYGFGPTGKAHIFNKRRKPASCFDARATHGKSPYMSTQKFSTVVIPVTQAQYNKTKEIFTGYCCKTPYDYAFFGMRCAAATRDVLGQIGIYKDRARVRYIWGTFYPKKLRHRLYRLAEKNNWTVIKQEGRATRKWEKD